MVLDKNKMTKLKKKVLKRYGYHINKIPKTTDRLR